MYKTKACGVMRSSLAANNSGQKSSNRVIIEHDSFPASSTTTYRNNGLSKRRMSNPSLGRPP